MLDVGWTHLELVWCDAALVLTGCLMKLGLRFLFGGNVEGALVYLDLFKCFHHIQRKICIRENSSLQVCCGIATGTALANVNHNCSFVLLPVTPTIKTNVYKCMFVPFISVHPRICVSQLSVSRVSGQQT